MSQDKIDIDEFLPLFEIEILDRYNMYINFAKKRNCAVKNCQISLLEHDPFNINFSALKESINQIKMDLKILYARRGNLIGKMRMSEGKIAGVVVYRLVKAHIIHIGRKCNACQHKCLIRENLTIPIMMGLEYIHRKYSELPEEVRKELIYTVRHRHVNQETLGLVFDALKDDT